jgi:cytochrome bd-type quinol oxidase subunit 2
MMIKVLVVAALAAILASLGSGLFFLVKDKGSTQRMARALTVRISLSVALFVLLLLAYYAGLIAPHELGR